MKLSVAKKSVDTRPVDHHVIFARGEIVRDLLEQLERRRLRVEQLAERVVDPDPIDPENGQDSEHECNENCRRWRRERDERQSFGAERDGEPTPE
jgi:hypothetical protein